jgi:Na+-driven multidrug efflux pump
MGTVIAQGISALLCILYIVRYMPSLKLWKADWFIGLQDVKDRLKLGIPVGFQGAFIALGGLILQYSLNGLGTVSVAAFSSAMKIDSFATLPLTSFATTLSVYTAQNYGARNIERIRRGFKQCTAMSVSFAVVIGVVNILFGQYLAAIFVRDEPQIVYMAHQYLIINGSCYVLHSLLNIFRHSLQGLGNGMVPALSSTMELVMRSFTAFVLIRNFGFLGACFAAPLSWLGAGLPMAVVYIRTMKKLR